VLMIPIVRYVPILRGPDYRRPPGANCSLADDRWAPWARLIDQRLDLAADAPPLRPQHLLQLRRRHA
jgi:hypothetical protein